MSSLPVPSPAPPVPSRKWRGYIVSPGYDAAFFLLSPALAGLGAVVLLPQGDSWDGSKRALVAVAVLAHVVAGLFRAYGNPAVFRAYGGRLLLVPTALFVLLLGSEWARAVALVLVVAWDVHHSSLQTFGLARIYHRLSGGDPVRGRRLDLAVDYFIYAGPLVVSGSAYMAQTEAIHHLAKVGNTPLADLAALARQAHPALATAVFLLALGLAPVYAGWHLLERRAGRPCSRQALLLHGATAACSIWSWGFNSLLDAVLIMKLFHVVQYFGLIAASESRWLAPSPLRPSGPGDLWSSLVVLLLACFPLAVVTRLASATPDASPVALSLVVTLTLLHFWSDGFIWSVRRRQV